MSKREHHSADEIERDIRATEDDIARTLDLLQEKLSPGAIVDALWKSSRDNSAQFAANFGRSVRDNPLPITLIGTGIAWLMLSRGGNGHHRHEAVAYSAAPEPHEEWPRETEDADSIYHAGVYQTGAAESKGYGETESYVAGSEGTAAAPTGYAAPGAPGSAESEALEGAEPPESGAAAAARRAEESARAAAHVAQERARSVTDRADASGQGAGSAAGETYERARSAAGETYEGAKSAAGETYERARSAAGETYERARSAAGETYEGAKSAAGGTYEGARSAAAGAYSSAKSATEGAYSGARSAAGKAYAGASSTAHKVYSGARGGAGYAAERLQAGGEAAYRRGSEMAYRTTSRATEAVSTMGSSFREHPIIAGAILLGIGALVGAMLPPTRREDALLGERSDSAKAMAAEAAEREARRAREVARAAAEGARREAEARGLTPGSIAGKAEEEIRRMADAGKEVARAAVREGEAAAKGEAPEKKDSDGDKGTSGDEEKRSDREERRSDPNKSEEEGSVRDPYLGVQVAPPPRPVVTPVVTDVQPGTPIEDKDPLKKED